MQPTMKFQELTIVWWCEFMQGRASVTDDRCNVRLNGRKPTQKYNNSYADYPSSLLLLIVYVNEFLIL